MAIDSTGTYRSTHPPRWLLKAIVMAVVAVMAGVLTWHAVSSLSSLLLVLLCALFVSLALEPLVKWLVNRGLRRGIATGVVMLGGIVLIAAIIAAFGSVFVAQVEELITNLPNLYKSVAEWADQQFHIELPASNDLLNQLVKSVTSGGSNSDLASSIIGIGGSVFGGIASLFAMGLIVFYMVAQGPRMRATLCRPLPPARQAEVLQLWETAQEKISGYINSRIALAAFSTVATSAFLYIIQVDYALPLGVFVGLVSQFVPTIGTYIAGAAPVLVALTSGSDRIDNNVIAAVVIIAFIVVYQQLENLVLSPKISARTMDINPAVAFVSVLAFGYVMGPIGAFLSLPLAATIQAVISTYTRRYELIDSDLLHDADGDRAEKRRDDVQAKRAAARAGAKAGAAGAAEVARHLADLEAAGTPVPDHTSSDESPEAPATGQDRPS